MRRIRLILDFDIGPPLNFDLSLSSLFTHFHRMRNKRASESVEEESDVVVAESRGEGQKKRVRTLATTQANPAELHLAATLFGTVDEAIERRQVVVDTPLEGMDGDADTPQVNKIVHMVFFTSPLIRSILTAWLCCRRRERRTARQPRRVGIECL